MNALKISAFDNHSSSYVIHSDGRVVVDNAADKQQDIYNFPAMLKKYSDMTAAELDMLQQALRQGNSGATVVTIGNISYYLIYESTDFEDWSVVGLVPTDIVNASMNSLQSISLILSAGITISIAALMIAYVIRRNKMQLKKKDTEILYPDELFSKLSVNVDDVFLMLNAEDLRVDYISPNIEKLVGIPEKQARADIHAMDILVQHDDTVRVLDKLHEILPGEQGEWDREYVHRKTGEVRWFHVIALCSDLDGEKKYIMVMSDRTRDKKINQALEDAVNAAQSANRAKSTFLSNMSHDIRTPMNGIIGMTAIAATHLDDKERVRDSLQKISQASKHMLSLINEVLDMSKIESGKRVLLAEDNDLNTEIAEEILKMTGLSVERAVDGTIAVDMMNVCEDGYYDLIFMDIQMPQMNGYDATRAIRAMNRSYCKQIPIIAMTANAFAEDVQAAKTVGMNEHIAKPLDMKVLAKTLGRWLR